MLRKLTAHLHAGEATGEKSGHSKRGKAGYGHQGDMTKHHTREHGGGRGYQNLKYSQDPEMGQARRNYWELSSDEEEEVAVDGESSGDGLEHEGSNNSRREVRFRIGERCRALYHSNDSFYPAEVIEVVPLDFNGIKHSYTVQFLKNRTVQYETRLVDLQRAFFVRSRSPMLCAGASCRAVDHDTDKFEPATIVRPEGRQGNTYVVQFDSSGIEQRKTRASEIQLDAMLPEFAGTCASVEGDGKKKHSTRNRHHHRLGKSRGSSLWSAARKGDSETVLRLLHQKVVDIDAPEPDVNAPEGKRTALYYAAVRGHLHVVKKLLQLGAEDIDGYAMVDATPEIRQFLSDYGFGKTTRDAKVLVHRSGISGDSEIEAVASSRGSATSSTFSALSAGHRGSSRSAGSKESFLQRSFLHIKRMSARGSKGSRHNTCDGDDENSQV